MTRVPSGNFSSRKPSPSWTSNAGVRSSTSSTKPGRAIADTPLVPGGVEGDFDGAEAAGRTGVADGLAPARQRVHGVDVPLERGGLGQRHGVREVPAP